MGLDGRVAEHRQPALNRRDLARLVRRPYQLCHQARTAVAFAGVQQVLEGQHGRPVGLVPVSRAQVQLGDRLGLYPTELTEQELSKQPVVAVPLAASIERDQERVRRLQPAQLFLSTELFEHGLTQWSAQLIEHRGAT